MTHHEYFINRVNVYNVPNLNKERFKFILNVNKLEAKIEALNSIEDKNITSQERYKLIKEFNKVTSRKTPEELYFKLNFNI